MWKTQQLRWTLTLANEANSTKNGALCIKSVEHKKDTIIWNLQYL